MVERILEVTRVKRVESYNANQRSFGESAKKKPELNFQHILDRKLQAGRVSDPYQVSLRPR